MPIAPFQLLISDKLCLFHETGYVIKPPVFNVLQIYLNINLVNNGVLIK